VKRRRSFREGFGYGGLSSVALILLGLASSIAIARVYGVEEIGRFALAVAPSLALTYLSTAQEQAALVRRLAVLEPRDPLVTGLFASVMAFSTALTTLVALITIGATVLLYNGPIGHPELIAPAAVLVAGQAFVTNPCWNLDMLLSAFRAGRELFWVRTNQAVAFLALAIGLGLAWGSVWGLVVATSGSWGLALLHRLAAARGYIRVRVPRSSLREGFRALPEMVRFGIRLAPAGVTTGVASQVGIWVLGAVAPVAAVGAYQRAWQLGNRFLEVNTRTSEMLLPTLVERQEGGDSAGFDRGLVDSMRYAALAMFLPAAVGGGAGYGVMELFGPGFAAAGDTLAVVLAVPALAAVSGAQAQALIAAGRPLAVTATSAGRMLVTVALTFLLAPSIGILGAALAWALGSAAGVLWLAYLVRPHMRTRLTAAWRPRQMAALALACGAGFAAARALDSAVAGVGGTALALVYGTLAYAIVFVLAGGVANRDRERARALGAALARRLPTLPARFARSQRRDRTVLGS
jgi:O-antigen/teichoic acid export membrane protein